ncbi:MAG TPA: hypothetical protein VLG50_03925 [Candidatus Saccharimonadales bacterium]|nr:hypothetical protein [Candidatus Saccharimonadales bacterium]
MNKYLFLICAFIVINYEINASVAALSSTLKNSKVLQSKEEFFEFLDCFFTRKIGEINSIKRPEFKEISFYMPNFKGTRYISFGINGERRITSGNLIENGQVITVFNPVEHKKEISSLIVARFEHYLSEVFTIDKFLKILYCERGGVAEFKNSELVIRYHDESEESMQLQQKEFIAMQKRQKEMQQELIVQRAMLVKLLEPRKFVSRSMQTE